MIPIMVNCTQTIIDEIACKKMKRKDIATSYYLAMFAERFGGEQVDWATINRAIMDRWSFSGLNWIKTQAWKMTENKQ